MSSTSDFASQLKKRKERACDACRRRKTKCDGPWMSTNICTNCTQTRKPCTYVEASKPRSPPKAYVTGLEDKLEALEAILKQIQPDVDFSEELGPPVIRNSWKTQNEPPTASSSNPITRTSSFASAGLPPILIPFHSDKIQSISSNPEVFPPPVSSHLVFHSQPRRARRPRFLDDRTFLTYRDSHNLSDDSTSESSSSSSETEELVITSIVGRTKITLRASENDDSEDDNNIRFHGRSSTAGLVETTRQFKHMHMRDTLGPSQQDKVFPTSPDNHTVAQTRRPQFWRTPMWETKYEGARADNPEILQDFLHRFPPADLMEVLIDLYFRHSNIIFPLLHRPTFNRQWKERLHHRNIWFACACSAIFAIGSRWCRDERVLPETSDHHEGANIDWRKAGCQYFDIALHIHTIRRSLFHPASLFEVQSITLMSMFLRGNSASTTAWFFIGGGIRKIQDVGAHRKKVYQTESNIDDELWKRAFWHLVVLDRLGGASLGRACGMGEEDFDLDLPLEVDDDYWDANQSEPFKQPQGIPSSVTAFNELIKLTQIVAFALKTLYAIDKSRIYRGLVPLKKESLVKQLSIALEEWKESLPEHLRWHGKMNSSVFSCQAATLLNTYYVAQMLVHRPSITSLASPTSDLDRLPADPAFSICIDAATSCAGIIKLQLQRGVDYVYVPNVIDTAHVAAAFLILNSWYLKVQDNRLQTQDIKPPLVQHIEKNIVDVKILLQTLENLKGRWDAVDSLLLELEEAVLGLDGFEPDFTYAKAQTIKQHSLSQADRVSSKSSFIIPVVPIKNQQRPRSNPSLRHRHSIAELPSLSQMNYTRQPQPPNLLPTTVHNRWLPPLTTMPRQQPEFELRAMQGPPLFGGRARALSATTSNVSWNDRALPLISSMRRTSFPNLASANHPHLERDWPGSRTPSEMYINPHYSGSVRYEDINMHIEDDNYPLNPRYMVQYGQPRNSPTKIHGSRPYDKRGHR